MTVRVARVPYLNAEAFYIDMVRRGLELHEILPSGVAPAIKEGRVDAGPVPLADAFRLEDQCIPVSGFCIATTDKARSVLLYSKQPIEELTGLRVGVTSESATPLLLLQVLLSLKHKVQPEAYVDMEEPHDAFLITDDLALRRLPGEAPPSEGDSKKRLGRSSSQLFHGDGLDEPGAKGGLTLPRQAEDAPRADATRVLRLGGQQPLRLQTAESGIDGTGARAELPHGRRLEDALHVVPGLRSQADEPEQCSLQDGAGHRSTKAEIIITNSNTIRNITVT